MNITTQASTFLFNTLDEDLRQDVFRAHPDKDISAMNETDLVKSIKHLAVIVESELVHRTKGVQNRIMWSKKCLRGSL